MEDNRKFRRFDLHLNVELKPNQDYSTYMVGITRNFSREGFSFVSEHFTHNDSETLEFRMLHPQKGVKVPVHGNIVWKRQVRDRCLAGVKIVKMGSEHKSEILDYAYDRWLEAQKFRSKKAD